MGVQRISTGAAALLLASVFVATPAAADDVHVIPIDPVSIDDPAALMDLYGGTVARARTRSAGPIEAARCGSAAASPVPDGRAIVVSLPPAPAFTVGKINPASWRRPPVTDPTWRLNYEGLMWMKSLALRAAQDGQEQSLAALVNQVVKFHRENPDPGTIQYGWDEGTALRRLETENCLYALTRSAALIPGMRADANVLLGKRYYGPPNYPVHNHGLMANLQLIRAADQINQPAWKTRAIQRMTAEAPLAFSSQGFSHEQSSGYQIVNVRLWQVAANEIEASTGPSSAVTQLRQTVGRGLTAFSWMTEPDGILVQIGDTEEDPGLPANPAGAPRAIRDNPTGWIIGRWSWTDPKTTYYTVRYGPARRAHGQHDRAGGVTFTARGVRVLVGPGKFNYDRTNNYYAYQLSPQSHNVPIPNGGKAGNGAATLSAYVVQSTAHAWTIKDTVYGKAHTRNVNVNNALAQMRVTDTFSGVSLQRQHWHLDPAWVKTSGGPNSKKLTFSHPSGRRLTVTTTGLVSTVIQGQTRPPMGWHFPHWGLRVKANEIVIRAGGSAFVTTFAVS